MKKIIVTLIALSFNMAYSADCEITTDRTPCAGKEVETLKPYKGKNPTVDKKPAKDETECSAIAEKSSKIIRKGTLAAKSVSAKFGDKSFGPFSDKSECK